MQKYLMQHLPGGETAKVVHFVGAVQEDYALCGQDLAGDEGLGWSQASPTKEKVNCPQCIAIVKHVWTIKNSEIY